MSSTETIQSPDEQIRAVLNTTLSLEEDFLTLGELLYKIRKAKLYRMKGYEKFGEFAESEYSISGSFAGKLANIYEDFIIILDKDANELSEIGMEKLYLLRSIMKLLDGKGALEEWYQKAMQKTLFEYRLDIKEFKEEQKEEDPRGDLIKQWKADWKVRMGWDAKTLQYYASLYFPKIEDDDLLNAFVVELQDLANEHGTIETLVNDKAISKVYPEA